MMKLRIVKRDWKKTFSNRKNFAWMIVQSLFNFGVMVLALVMYPNDTMILLSCAVLLAVWAFTTLFQISAREKE